jgi:hypothetical protein
MRRLTATQVAAMTASLSVLGNLGTRYGIPVFGIVATAHADSYDDDELEEVVVTGYTGTPWVVETYHPGTSGVPPTGGGGTSTPPTQPPVARAPTTATTSVQRNAVRCAERYSIVANANSPDGQRGGQPAGYTTQFVAAYGWGANSDSITPKVVTSTTNAPPDANHTQRIVGWTSTVQHVSFIYTLSINYDVQQTGVNLESHLINTIVHEWGHAWWPYYVGEAPYDAIGDEAQSLYEQGGGANASCNIKPPRYGNLGGRK